ncbi:hypothetical protein BJ684DRAFT_14705 [Piptocephalis cylindrospora]|uniref:Uncharacterized protein n=1 Tax=Piptocephalis cylindrospora TaxID=1907219 RepID=A0A4P9Y9B3_9FUNG|nr:hypothetical protein BJ684DRAFT_14705 [Piptocephalis cylindrospora]|eukprot:RKP15001.1 hypothetical protein BJ684DRAFT_14705 [Piptocephalis cylindrospora]
MDLSLDPLHQGKAPGEMPCRWLVSIRECKDEWYYVGSSVFGMVLATTMASCGILLVGMTMKKRELSYTPWRWNSSTWAYVGFICLGFHHIALSLVMILNPGTSYAFRLFLQFFFFIFSHNCTLPYLFSLLSTKFVIIWQNDYQERARRRTRMFLYTTPVIFLLVVILMPISGSLIDHRLPEAGDIVFRVGMGVCILGNAIASWVCYVYGYRFARLLSRQLKEIDSQVGVSMKVPTVSPTPNTSETPVSSRPTSPYYNFDAPAAPRVAHTFVEGTAVLRMMGIVNYLFVGVNTVCLTIALLCMVFPVQIYTVPIFSKILFFFAVPNRIAFKSALSVSMVLVELRRQQDQRDLQGGRFYIMETLCAKTNRYFEFQQLQSKGCLVSESDPCHVQSDHIINPLSSVATTSTAVVLDEGLLHHRSTNNIF